jgi:hypothetical protein
VSTTITCATDGSKTWTTIAAAVAAIPSTPTGGYIVSCYNTGEFANGADISGYTTSLTDFIEVSAAANESFQDNAGVRSNPLYYDQSKGVGISQSVSSSPGAFNIGQDYTSIKRLQIKVTHQNYGSGSCVNVVNQGQPNILVKDCVLVYTENSSGRVIDGKSALIANCLLVSTANTAGLSLYSYSYNGSIGRALNCTIISTASAATGVISSGNVDGTNNTLNNTAIFGFTAATSGSPAGDYSATDVASGLSGAHSQFNLTASNQFTSATVDFRLKAGAALINAGNTDATNAPNDISGYARGAGIAGDIGAWEATAVASIAQFSQRTYILP